MAVHLTIGVPKGEEPKCSIDGSLQDLTNWLDEEENLALKEETMKFWIEVKGDAVLYDVQQLMSIQGARIAFITDKSRKPIAYITTGDIRRFLLK